MEFKIPPRFKEVLEQNIPLAGLVNSCLGEFGPWLERNHIKFFTEYTDHSLRHVEQVLVEADEMIRELCRDVITPSDVATLVLATLLHDCAMHLSVDGFIELIQSDNRPQVPGFGDKPWNLLWADFMAGARRYSGRQLMALFGDTTPVNYPPMKSNDMTGRDLLLIGEFLRQHHHRLAHEIALYGVPGPRNNRLKISYTDDTKHIVELAGVIARSHGISLRDSIPYLRTAFHDEKVYKGVHIVFMMTLLRVADILQIQSDRAPQQVEKVQRLLSPFSIGEWEMHQAIEFINKDNADPENIVVIAHPDNVKTYLKIRRVLDQIQHELDNSWTVIGETYGYIQKFREIGLRYRRIKSNIDDLDTFSKQVEYIPVQASFEVADTDLLKLLIEPLYGDAPEIGIRELLQNSLDAVLERVEYQELHKKEIAGTDLSDQTGEVVITVDQDNVGWYVTVSDRGIGMTLDTVREYFLKIGASIRRSEVWRKTFENDEGNSRVLRSGRFGVGVLAAFLLGDEVTVSTRHISEPRNRGLQFSVQLDTDVIEFKRIDRPIGTTIRIYISENTKNRLSETSLWTHNDSSWDWYCLQEPRVTRLLNKNLLQQHYTIPSLNAESPFGWRHIKDPRYADIAWTYLDAPALTCNGIIVRKPREYSDFEGISDSICQYLPNVSIFDPNANLPLNLSRTDLTSPHLPFHEELLDDVIKDFIAFNLVNMPSQPLTQASYYRWYSRFQYTASSDFEGRGFCPWYSTKLGVGLRDNYGHPGQQLDIRSALVIFNYSKDSPISESIDLSNFQKIDFDDSQVVLGFSLNNWEEDQNLRPEEFSWTIRDVFRNDQPFENFINLGGRLLIGRCIVSMFSNVEELFSELNHALFSADIKVISEWENQNWLLLKIGNCPFTKFDFDKFISNTPEPNLKEWPCMIAELYVQPSNQEYKLSHLAQIWRDVIKLPVIPYDLHDRREKLAYAYQELASYIKIHEILRNGSNKIDDNA